MSCFDWRRLLAHRFAAGAPEPEGWGEALAHLDGCAACRSEAFALDPTLAFRELPVPEVGSTEVAEMRHAVRAVRRAGRAAGARAVSRSRPGWRAAAVGFVTLAALTLGMDSTRQAPETAIAVQGPLGLQAPAGLSGDGVDLARMPLIEEIDRPRARVYQFGSAELAVVLIVDESFDV